MILESLSGGILGVGGAIVQKWLDGKNLDKQSQAEIAKLSLEYGHKERLVQLGVSEKEYEALKASIDSDKGTYSAGSASKLLQLADFIRGITRPSLTIYLIIFNSSLLAYLVSTYDLAFTKEQAYDIAKDIVTCLLSCTTLALGWWFGARKIN